MRLAEVRAGRCYEGAGGHTRFVASITGPMASIVTVTRGAYPGSTQPIGTKKIIRLATFVDWAIREVPDPRIQEETAL